MSPISSKNNVPPANLTDVGYITDSGKITDSSFFDDVLLYHILELTFSDLSVITYDVYPHLEGNVIKWAVPFNKDIIQIRLRSNSIDWVLIDLLGQDYIKSVYQEDNDILELIYTIPQ